MLIIFCCVYRKSGSADGFLKNNKSFVVTLALVVSVISCQSILPYSYVKKLCVYYYTKSRVLTLKFV